MYDYYVDQRLDDWRKVKRNDPSVMILMGSGDDYHIIIMTDEKWEEFGEDMLPTIHT